MNKIQVDILTITYQQYELGKNTTIHFNYDEYEEIVGYEKYENCLKKYTTTQLMNSYDFLENNNFIQEIFCGSNFATFSITNYGLEYCKNGFKNPNSVSVTQGDNSILVNGSYNTVSNNYSTIYKQIQQSDVCEEHKELLCQLIKELSNKSEHQIYEAVKTCMLKILKTGTNVAISHSVSLLITAIFARIP